MHILRSAIFTLLFVIAILLGFMVFKFDTGYALKLTEKEYEQKHYENALATLEKVKKKSAKAYLYQGYTLRALAQHKNAQNAFKAAFELAETSHLKYEASFNLLYTAYLKSDYAFMRMHLPKIPRDLAFARLFSALCEYQAKNYDKAYALFNQVKEPQFYSSWMKQAWQDQFPLLWKVSHRAHCLIEMGEFDQSRKLLEEHLEEQEMSSSTAYLLALSHLKESRYCKTIQKAVQSFERAGLYGGHLSKESFAKLFNFERFSHYSLPIWTSIIKNGSSETFERWVNLQLHLGLFSPTHQAKVIEIIQPQMNNLCTTRFFLIAPKLASLPWSKSQQAALETIHMTCLATLIEEEQFDSLNLHLSELHRLLSWTSAQKQHINEVLLAQLNALADEENTLSEMYDCLLIWDSLQREEKYRVVFIEKMLPIIEKLWSTDSKMAFELAKWTDQFAHSTQKETVHQFMFDLLQNPLTQDQSEGFFEANQYFNPPYHP